MAHQVQEVATRKYEDEDGNIVERKEVDTQATASGRSIVQQIVYTVTGILTVLLSVRIVLSLFAANRSNAFADFIYTLTAPLVSPFRGLFNVQTQAGNFRFEVETLVAILVYAFVGWMIVQMLDIGRTSTVRR